MLNFFRKAAKVFLIFFFWVFIIFFFVIGIVISGSPLGINMPYLGVGFIFGGWIITILFFSLGGAFLAMVEDIAVIRKKLESNIAVPITQISNEDENDEENFGNDDMWKCKKCNCFNEASSIFCIYCGENKLSDLNTTDSNSSVDSAKQTESKHWQCIKCGHTNDDSYKFCGNCGAPKP